MLTDHLIYILVTLSVSFIGHLGQKTRNRKKNNLIYYLLLIVSFSILFVFMGFREFTIGVDGANYIKNYNIANSISFKEYYQKYTTEPGFYLLYRIVYFIFDDYQWLFIISAFITILFFYRALIYESKDKSFGLLLFIFTTTQYFYYFGIMRMGIAVSIVTYSYKFIINNQKNRYILNVLIATLFHYSALFALFAIFFQNKTSSITNKKKVSKKRKLKNQNILIIGSLIPISFIIVDKFLFKYIKIERYLKYINRAYVFNPTVFVTIFIYVALSMLGKKDKRKNKNVQFYYFLLQVKIFTELFGSIIGITRMVWYTNISIVFLFAYVISLYKFTFKKIMITFLIVLYSTYYSYYAYFGNSFRGETMLPYRSSLIKRNK